MQVAIKECNVKYNDIKINKDSEVYSFDNIDIVETSNNIYTIRKYLFIDGICNFIIILKENYSITYNDDEILFVINVSLGVVNFISYNRNNKKYKREHCTVVEYVERFKNGYKILS